ncbi:MAG: DUF3047 domain-containing protein [Nitrospinae bacterium]|nr:DUF3047 domain-containing protein [Nitrospinota bacterium]
MRHVYPAIFAVTVVFVAIQLSGSAFAQSGSVVVTDFVSSPNQKNSEQLPKGWALKVWQGRADVRLIQDGSEHAKVLRMRSDKASVSIYRKVKLDPRKFPVLSWKWKVTKLPDGADARYVESDDQAAGVYVVFPRFPSFFNSQFIGYVWETNVPEGTILRSRKNPMVHYIVIRSGMDNLNKWIIENRNIMDDYRRVFGSAAPRVGGIALMIDTDDTLSVAESFFANVVFKGDASRTSMAEEYNRFAKAADSTAWIYE